MRVYKHRSEFLEKYLEAGVEEQLAMIEDERSRVVNGVITHEILWYDLIELGGLDFSFGYQYRYMNIGTKRDKIGDYVISFTYKNVDDAIILHSISGYRSVEEFISINGARFPQLYVRIPNLRNRFNRKKLNSIKDITNQALIEQHTNNTINRVVDIVDMIDLVYGKKCTYPEFDRFVTESFRSMIIRLYSEIKISDSDMRMLNEKGWVMMGLDEIDEIIEIFIDSQHSQNFDCILFRRGIDCMGVKNGAEGLVNYMSIFGNLKRYTYKCEDI